MKYYVLEPEVAGQLGNKSKLVYEEGRVKEVIFLEYVFLGWLGDELLNTTSCYIITKSLKNDVIKQGLTGFEIDRVKISFSREYFELGGSIFIPKFVRLKPLESYEENMSNLTKDFYYNKYKNLVVSERALKVICRHKLDMCGVVELK